MISTLPPINIDCIMPAAGLSSRMGEWKLILPYQHQTMIEVSIKHALMACSRVILVVGYRSDELIDIMRRYPKVKVVVNEDYQRGMLSSIQLGVEQVCSEYFFVVHADMPCIKPETFYKLWQSRAKGSVFPGDNTHSGHPVLINAALKEFILRSPSTGSMKSILKNFPMDYLKLKDDGINFDVDTPAAYQALQAIGEEK